MLPPWGDEVSVQVAGMGGGPECLRLSPLLLSLQLLRPVYQEETIPEGEGESVICSLSPGIPEGGEVRVGPTGIDTPPCLPALGSEVRRQ